MLVYEKSTSKRCVIIVNCECRSTKKRLMRRYVLRVTTRRTRSSTSGAFYFLLFSSLSHRLHWDYFSHILASGNNYHLRENRVLLLLLFSFFFSFYLGLIRYYYLRSAQNNKLIIFTTSCKTTTLPFPPNLINLNQSMELEWDRRIRWEETCSTL